ncbi:MAG TPA: hypothetical protein VHT04_07740 [Stellaceae bacterium]|nr:hypothetical protein [Stellaceae bacterium]
MMQRPLAALLAGALFGAAALNPAAAGAQTLPAASPTAGATLAINDGAAPPEMLRMVAARDDWPVDRRLLAIGAGAVVAVVAFNVLAAPLGTVPLAGGALAPVPYSVALGSRLIAATTAGAGALAATFAYDKWTGHQSDYAYLLSLGAGALAGVAIGNWLTAGTVGMPPYYAGAGVANAAGAMATSAAQAASRVYVIGSGVIGAWVADWLYRRSDVPGP